jgi:hypothetical protein
VSDKELNDKKINDKEVNDKVGTIHGKNQVKVKI